MSGPTTTASTAPISPARFAEALAPLSLPTLHLKVLEIRNSISHLRSSNVQLLPFAMGTEAAVGEQPGQPDRDCADAIRENEAVIERMQERVRLIRQEVENRGVSWREFEDVKADEGLYERQEGEGGEGESEGEDAVQRGGQSRANGTTATATTNRLQAARDEEERIARGAGPAGRASQQSSSGPSLMVDGGAVQHPAWSDGTFQTGVIRNGVLEYDDVPGQSLGRDVSATGGRAETVAPSNGNGDAAPVRGGRLTDEQLQRAVEQQMRDMEDDEGGENNEGGMHL